MRHRHALLLSLPVTSLLCVQLTALPVPATTQLGLRSGAPVHTLSPIEDDTTSSPIDPMRPTPEISDNDFPSLSRAPTFGAGMYMHWMVMMINVGLRFEVEPVRDVLSIWGSVGLAPYFLSSDGSYSPSWLELGAGIRVHPLPIGEAGRFYVDLERRSYWGLSPWSIGAGIRLGKEYRTSRVSVGLGLTYEWGDDTRGVKAPGSTWRMVWVDLTGVWRMGLDEL